MTGIRGHRAVVQHRLHSSVVQPGSPTVAKLIKKAVPRLHREFDAATGGYVVFASRVPALMAAFDVAEVEVHEIGGAE